MQCNARKPFYIRLPITMMERGRSPKISVNQFPFRWSLAYSFIERIHQWPVMDIGGWPLVNESSWIKKPDSLYNLPRVIKYKTGAVVRILATIRFILFHADSFTRGQSNMRRFIFERSTANIRDWSLAYSFICHTSIYKFYWTYISQRDGKLEWNCRLTKSPEYENMSTGVTGWRGPGFLRVYEDVSKEGRF